MTSAILAAAAAALGYGLASVLQAMGARRATAAGGGTVDAARQPLYVAGLALDLVAWLLSLLALRRLPLFAVQAVLSGSVAVTVVVARAVFRERLRRADGVAVTVTVLALVVIGAAAGAEGAGTPSRAVQWVVLGLVPFVALACLAASRRGVPVVTAAVAGLAFGGTAFSARGLSLHGSWSHVATQPLAIALVLFGLTGLLGYANALERGAVGPVTAALWTAEVIAPAAAGIAVLHDTVRHGWAAPAAVATALAVAATVVLAGSPAIV